VRLDCLVLPVERVVGADSAVSVARLHASTVACLGLFR
jgi:hypothetical protein